MPRVMEPTGSEAVAPSTLVVASTFTSPSKRGHGTPRRSLSGSTTRQDDDGSAGSTSSITADLAAIIENESTDSRAKICSGCDREFQKDKCFLEPHAFVKWQLPDGRGCWCADCFSVWRTSFQQDHPLAIFGKWIRLSTDNEEEWKITMLATLSLKFEGASQIRKPMVATRIQVLRWLFEMVGFSLCARTIVTLAEAMKKNYEFKANQLVQLQRDDDRWLGVALSLPDSSCESSTSTKRVAVPRLPNCGLTLALTSDANEISLLEEYFGAELLNDDERSSAPLYCIEDAAPQKCKYQSRLNVLIDGFRTKLDVLSDIRWESSAKESSFTALLTKVNTLSQDARAEGRKAVAESASTWAESIAASKTFIRKKREFNKSRRTHEQFMALSTHALLMVTLHNRVGLKLKLAPSLRLLVHKANMFVAITGGCEEEAKTLAMFRRGRQRPLSLRFKGRSTVGSPMPSGARSLSTRRSQPPNCPSATSSFTL